MKFAGEHYEGLHKVSSINPTYIIAFKNMINEKSCDVFANIKVIKRIGSVSVYATVWEINFLINSLDNKYIKMAIKIQRDREKTLEEININIFLNQYPDYFLQMYDSIYCEQIELKDSVFSGYFMFLELAIGDLKQLLRYSDKVSEAELLTIISQVFDSIYILGKSTLFHGDLHIGNVFIVPRNISERNIGAKATGNTIRAVIGDFGETIAMLSITSHTSDIYKFCTSLSSQLVTDKKFPNTYRKLKNIVKYTNTITSDMENDFEKFTEQLDEQNLDENIYTQQIDQYFEKVVGNTISTIKGML